MTAEAARIIAVLELAPLPQEGGFFRKTWVSERTLRMGEAARFAASSIYFLLTPQDFSALHRLRADEIWHFHAGDALEHVQLDPGTGESRVVRLGVEVLAGEVPQLVVRGGVWQGARLARWPAASMAEAVPRGWALLSCTMTPAWDERDFELGERARLTAEFPTAAELIATLTR